MDIRIIDTHCHPQFSQFDVDRSAVIERALSGGVGMFCIGTDAVTSKRAIELANRYEGIWASVGVHPNDVRGASDADFITAFAQEPKVIAIGEVGLDYYRTKGEHDRLVQAEALERFIELSELLQKPLIIHCRDAHDDMLRILKNATSSKQGKPRGIIHSFNGSPETALHYIELGFHIGLNGIITFSTQYDEMVRSLPVQSIVLETDAPYLAPPPHRGKRNEPSFVQVIAAHLALVRDEEPQAFLVRVVATSMAYIPGL